MKPKKSKAGLWINSLIKRRGLKSIGNLAGALGLSSAYVNKLCNRDTLPTNIIRLIEVKWNIKIPKYLHDSQSDASPSEDESDDQERPPPDKALLRIIDLFVTEYKEEISDIISPETIIQERNSQWGKELRKRRSRRINAVIFHLPTIKAIYLQRMEEIKQKISRQTLKNLINGVAMDDLVYLRFCQAARIELKDIIHPYLKPLMEKFVKS